MKNILLGWILGVLFLVCGGTVKANRDTYEPVIGLLGGRSYRERIDTWVTALPLGPNEVLAVVERSLDQAIFYSCQGMFKTPAKLISRIALGLGKGVDISIFQLEEKIPNFQPPRILDHYYNIEECLVKSVWHVQEGMVPIERFQLRDRGCILCDKKGRAYALVVGVATGLPPIEVLQSSLPNAEVELYMTPIACCAVDEMKWPVIAAPIREVFDVALHKVRLIEANAKK